MDLESEQDRNISLGVPLAHPGSASAHSSSRARRQSQHYSSGHASTASAPETTPTVLKTPSKKWSFSSALNLRLSSSPSSSGQKSGFPLSPRAVTFGQQLRKSTSKDQAMASSKNPWSPNQPAAMTSVTSLASLSSIGSVRTPALQPAQPCKTPDNVLPSPNGTTSSASTHHTTSVIPAPQQPDPLSPNPSVRRGQSKRLTPSSIPFFRRSSSQSMQIPPHTSAVLSSSPTLSTGMTPGRPKSGMSPPKDGNSSSTSAPVSTHKKSSVLSLGLPSLLKGSSSRRSLHSESKEAAKEIQRVKEALKEAEKERARQEKTEKERQKKEDKDRSESRISNLISRKRGKAS